MNYYYQQQYRSPIDNDVRDLVISKLFNGLATASIISVTSIFIGLPAFIIVLAIIAEIATIIGYFFARSEATIERLYYTFVASSAVLLGVMLQSVVFYLENGLAIVGSTFAITGLVFGLAYSRSQSHYIDTNSLGRKILPFSIIFIVLILISFFITIGSVLYIFMSFFGALLFTAYLYWDLGRLQNQQFFSPAKMAWSLYWDILLVFRYLLQLLTIFFGRD